MMARVYIETSVVSYLTSRPSRDIVVAGHQQITHDWWETRRREFELVASHLVVQEAGTGDPVAARLRVEALGEIELLAANEDSYSLAKHLVDMGVLPRSAADDALHLAIAVTNGVEYLLTWNCKHLANATLRKEIEAVCRSRGYGSVIICTPEELMGE
jgi:predicted nucleic acid-binding protein